MPLSLLIKIWKEKDKWIIKLMKKKEKINILSGKY